MADTYIDYKEMSIYGEHTVTALSQLEVLSAGISGHRMRLQGKTADVVNARGAQRSIVEASGGTRESRDTLQTRVIKALRSLKSHLDSINNDEDSVDIELGLFFEKGILGDLSNSTPAQVLLKADFALNGFGKSGDFAQKKEKQDKLSALASELKAAIGQSSGARPEEATASTELQKAGEAWRREYRGLKWIVWGLLIQEEREGEYSSYFKDESVGSRPSNSEPIVVEEQGQ